MYIASGIMFSGGGIGITFLGLLIEFLIEFYGWRGSLIILSGISLQFCVCGALVYNNTVERPRHPEVINLMNGETVKTEKPSKMTTAGDDHHTTLLKQKTFFRDINFWLIVGAFTFMQMSSSSIYFFFKDILIYKGLGPTFKLFITCIGVTSTVGRLCAGLLTSYITPSLFYFVIGNICALALLMLAFIDDHWSVIAIACVFGVCHGMMCVLQSLKIAHAFGKEQMPIVWGYAMGLAGIGVLVGPPLGGEYLCPSS